MFRVDKTSNKTISKGTLNDCAKSTRKQEIYIKKIDKMSNKIISKGGYTNDFGERSSETLPIGSWRSHWRRSCSLHVFKAVYALPVMSSYKPSLSTPHYRLRSVTRDGEPLALSISFSLLLLAIAQIIVEN